MTSNLLCPAPVIRVYDNPSAFRLLEEDWKALFQQHGGWNVFLSWQWFHHWWNAFGSDKELQILALSSEDRLLGVAPMMVEPGESGVRQMALIGSDRTTDYGDVLVDPEYQEALCEALAEFLQEGLGHRWGRVEMRSVPAGSPLLAGFRGMAQRRGMESFARISNTCPTARLASSWDEYLATLGKTHRHELRRKIRRSQVAGAQTFQHLTAPEEVAAGLESFFRLHRASRPDKAAFLDDTTASFFRSVSDAFAREGWMRLNLMQIDGREVAACMAFSRQDRILLYNSGLDPDYRVHSVGIALHAADVQQAIGLGKVWYDFLRGNEPYKYDFGAKDSPIFTLTLLPAGSGEEEEESDRG